MEIPEEAIAEAARPFVVFAYEEGNMAEIREAKACFNKLVEAAYRIASRSELMTGFHRPTTSEFRQEFITRCRQYAKRIGMI